MDLIVGTFNTPDLFTLAFSPPTATSPDASLTIIRASPAIGNHSWLALSPLDPTNPRGKRFLYATAWTDPPSVAAYSVHLSGREIQFLNAKHVRARSGYVCASKTHVYSAGGPTSEAFKLEADGRVGDLVQELSFVDDESSSKASDAPHGDFGGLRSGSHSVDLAPDHKSLYIADIGRNCIWTYSINHTKNEPHLKLGSKHISPRSNDGPRHTWPHPGGRILYSLQEHSSMVDVFSVAADGVTLSHLQGVKIIPTDKDPKHYWADEVRLSTTDPSNKDTKPNFMYASTRGLQSHTKGYVAVFALNADGTLASEEAIHIWQTPTSGGIANAIEPAPWRQEHGEVEYLAMTDSEEGWVFALSFDGKEIREVARVSLGKTEEGNVKQAATAVWL